MSDHRSAAAIGSRGGSRWAARLKVELLNYRSTRRAAVWLGILRGLHGVGPFEQLKLVLSAALDTVTHLILPSFAPSPKAPFACRLYAPAVNASFCVRAGTDDVYNVLPFGECDVHHAVLDTLSAGDVFVDVGANIGYYSIVGAGRVGRTGRVVAIEALPATADQLSKNLLANSIHNVDVIRAAVYDGSASEVELTIPSNVFGMAAIGGNSRRENVTVARVRAATLDDVCAALPRIRVMKLDIEGSELEALKGARATLAKTDRLVIEVSRKREAVEAFLLQEGFDLRPLSFEGYILARRRSQCSGHRTHELSAGDARSVDLDGTPQGS